MGIVRVRALFDPSTYWELAVGTLRFGLRASLAGKLVVSTEGEAYDAQARSQF
jgi:hypothetical protein